MKHLFITSLAFIFCSFVFSAQNDFSSPVEDGGLVRMNLVMKSWGVIEYRVELCDAEHSGFASISISLRGEENISRKVLTGDEVDWFVDFKNELRVKFFSESFSDIFGDIYTDYTFNLTSGNFYGERREARFSDLQSDELVIFRNKVKSIVER